jgi:hypothetical protein
MQRTEQAVALSRSIVEATGDLSGGCGGQPANKRFGEIIND